MTRKSNGSGSRGQGSLEFLCRSHGGQGDRWPACVGVVTRKATGQFADLIEDRREDRAVDSDGNAGQEQAIGICARDGLADRHHGDVQQSGNAMFEKAQLLLPNGPDKEAGTKLTCALKLVDQAALHQLTLGSPIIRGGGFGLADGTGRCSGFVDGLLHGAFVDPKLFGYGLAKGLPDPCIELAGQGIVQPRMAGQRGAQGRNAAGMLNQATEPGLADVCRSV